MKCLVIVGEVQAFKKAAMDPTYYSKKGGKKSSVSSHAKTFWFNFSVLTLQHMLLKFMLTVELDFSAIIRATDV